METSKETANYNDIEETHKGRISWPAIFAGTVIMLITLMLLSLLGIGIGLGSIKPAEDADPLNGLGTGTLIWWVLSNLIAVFAGGYVAANLTNVPYKMTGAYHGILSWSLYALISFWIMTTAVGGILSGAGGAVSKSLSGMGGGISKVTEVVGAGDTDRMKEMIQDAIEQDQPTNGTKHKKFDINITAVIQDVFFVNGKIKTNVQRQDVEKSIASNSTLSKADVQHATDVMMSKYQEAQQKWQQVKPKVEEAAQKVTETGSKAAIWGFVALLLGAITAGIAGVMGQPVVVAETHERTTV